jgi:hypothetical protein
MQIKKKTTNIVVLERMALLFRIPEVSDSNNGLVTGNPDLTRGYAQPFQENAVIVAKSGPKAQSSYHLSWLRMRNEL